MSESDPSSSNRPGDSDSENQFHLVEVRHSATSLSGIIATIRLCNRLMVLEAILSLYNDFDRNCGGEFS